MSRSIVSLQLSLHIRKTTTEGRFMCLCIFHSSMFVAPLACVRVQDGLAEMMKEMERIDAFEYSLSDDAFQAFWSTLAWPNRVKEQIERVHEAAAEKREAFAAAQTAEQEAFNKSLDKLERVINGFDKHKDFSKVRDVAGDVAKLQDELRDAEEKRALFNKREVIFGTEQTDYSQLGRM
eukprot:4704322-Pleurochrysis_carterae.AAC.1